jgi:hypothetical protein
MDDITSFSLWTLKYFFCFIAISLMLQVKPLDVNWWVWFVMLLPRCRCQLYSLTLSHILPTHITTAAATWVNLIIALALGVRGNAFYLRSVLKEIMLHFANCKERTGIT